jgi:ribosomal protein S18 acetylase RimI-like enzyme
VLIAQEQGRLVGSVQLVPCGKTNQPHRADVQKLLVLASARGRGIGAALMRALEARAREAGRWLLMLDTRTDSGAERCYRRAGGCRVPGAIALTLAKHPHAVSPWPRRDAGAPRLPVAPGKSRSARLLAMTRRGVGFPPQARAERYYKV